MERRQHGGLPLTRLGPSPHRTATARKHVEEPVPTGFAQAYISTRRGILRKTDTQGAGQVQQSDIAELAALPSVARSRCRIALLTVRTETPQ